MEALIYLGNSLYDLEGPLMLTILTEDKNVIECAHIKFEKW